MHELVNLRVAACFAGLLLGNLAALPATAASAGAEESTSAIEEVIVTARYRAESVQNTPISMTAFSEQALENIIALDLRAVGPSTVNVHIQPVVTFQNSAAVHIRGMGGQGIESTGEMRNGVSIDGVFISRPVATLIDLFDIERIEVLRGPQGTTFGKNSLSGGLNITTIKPDGTFGIKAEVTGGNEGREDYRGAVQFPIIKDKLAMRISGLSQNYDGHFKNRVNGEDLNGEDVDTFRGTLVWTPTENFDATLVAWNLDENSTAPGGDNDPDTGDDPRFPAQILQFTGPDDGTFTVGRDALDFADTDQTGYTLIMNWDIGEYTLTSVSGYIDTDDLIASDFDQTEIPFFPTFRDQEHEQWSTELRVQTDYSQRSGFLGNLDLVLGLYYFHQEHELVQSFPTLGPSADYAHQDGDSQAVFGSAIYALNDQWNLIFGVRYTDEDKDFERNPGVFQPQLDANDPSTRPTIGEMSQTPMTVNGDLNDSQTTFKVGVDYQWLDQTMVYATFSQGFKAGEFGARAASDFTVGPTKPETSDSYEIGIKSDLFDNRLRINAAAFYTKYDDLQFGVFIPNPDNPTGQETQAQNIGEATIAGFEIEVTAVPIDNLTLAASYGYIDAEYDDFCADLNGPSAAVNPVSDCNGAVVELPDGTFLIDQDHTDNDLSRAPESNIYLSADYWLPTNIGNWFARVSTSWQDNYFSDGVLNHPKAETGDFWLWDSSAGWESGNGDWRVTAWCKNCGDKEYVSGLTPVANFFNQKFYGDPQTYGVTLRWQY